MIGGICSGRGKIRAPVTATNRPVKSADSWLSIARMHWIVSLTWTHAVAG
jgi:hypothetical protein